MQSRTSLPLEIPVEAFGAEHWIAAELTWRPDRPHHGLLVTVPGGTYDRSYWDLHVPEDNTYSFADVAAAAGWTVLLLDNLGTGASSGPASQIGVLEMADAVAQATRYARSHGPRLPGKPVVGVGHSLGGQVVIAAQARHAPFDRVAALGSSFLGNAELGVDAREAAEASLRAMSGASWESGALTVPRDVLRPQFHAPDVPDAVLRAERAGVTVLPREAGIAAIVPALLGPITAAVEVPVLLAYAERDMSPNPRAETAAFTGSADVTLFLLPGSAHCHNTARTRHRLWDRLLIWAHNWIQNPKMRTVSRPNVAVPGR